MDKAKKILALLGTVSVLAILVGLISCNEPARERQTPTNTESKITVYPHSADFKAKHGEAFHKSAGQCFKCHGSDLNGGSAKVSCKTCHGGSFPHPSHWSKPTGHGEAFAKADEAGRKMCVTCHLVGNDKSARTVGCFDCHKAYPHDQLGIKGFKTGKHKAIAGSFEGKCMSCHTDYTKNMPEFGSDGGCLSCHSGKLSIEWKEPPEVPEKASPPASAPESAK